MKSNSPMSRNVTVTFDTAQEARDFRHVNGTGGWIFENDETGEATLFSPHLCPSDVFHHPMTRGKSGRLIGSA